ncbi:formylglycine-generating enzyme family protein [Photobacterium carnosum]|uniref:formylglycine-generating enzyme family protein n=1 Tax=Photobacterium carnosum TaxID=2023717 RepID=UPI0024324AF0|nr:SUMF1/EgtB/PvdO family nonheme iron enzyme [Photobacterium carnosum]
MSKYSKLFTALFLFVFSFVSPKLFASSGTITFKLPDNASIKFQPIFLGLDGNKVFASKRVKLGSREGGDSNYKERLSTTNLGGSFVSKNDNGDQDWLYYLGQTEVSQQQWNAVMRWWQRENKLTVEPENKSQLPQTGKTPAEIFTFIQALNLWMLKNDRDALPKNGNAIAYVRLPTEVEWAYAARGGNKVSHDVFDRPYPYIDENGNETLDGYEWDRGSSGNHVKEVGSQYIQPNPIGLYDMLGNVEELTYGIFGQDFLFARFGGLVIRGGNYSTDPEDLKVSLRTEYDGYTQDGNILRLKKVGFRLALGSLVSETGHTADELDQGYDEYLSSDSGVTQSAAVGKTSLSQQAINDQLSHSNSERERLIEDNKSLRQQNSNIESKFVTLQGKLEQKTNDLDSTAKDLESERSKNNTLTKLADISSIEKKFNIINNSKDLEITRLHSELTNLKQKVNYQGVALINAEASQKQVLSLQQEVNDADRRDNTANFEIEKNKKRIVVAEKRLLEALTRVADYNLFSAWRNLEIIKKKRQVSNNPTLWRVNQLEAKNMLIEYRRYVIQIVDNTDYTLFPEVKANLARWLKDNKVSNQQIKGLNLLERHIKEVREGKYLEVNDLYKNLLNEPEMRGSNES